MSSTQSRPFSTNFRHSIEKSSLSSSSANSSTNSSGYQSRIGSNKKLNTSKPYLNSSKNFQELYATDKLGLSLTNSMSQKPKSNQSNQSKPDLSKQNIKSYLKKHLEKSDAQPRIKNSNFSSFKLKNSTDLLTTNRHKLSVSREATPRSPSSIKFNQGSKMASSSNSFMLDDISQMIVAIENDQKRLGSESSVSNKPDLVDQMASFIEELKDFIDDRLIDTTSQLEMANKKIGDLCQGINYLTNELVCLKYQNQELKNIISDQMSQKKEVQRQERQSKNSSLKNLDTDLLSIYKKEDSQGSSINFYDNVPSVEQKSYRTSSQIDFTPIQIVNCVSSDLNQEEDDDEVKSAFQNEDLDESNIELSSSSNNEEVSSAALDEAGLRAERERERKQQHSHQQRCLLDMKRNDLNKIKLLNQLQTSIKTFPINLLNEFDAQYSWDYTDQNNMPVSANSKINKVKK
ncbi:hypothetical protein BpHYR1_012063 [Brachionus plicatilis]|uniref:Uncharacterized protein n=1 Tax=Brachionus plicatilis TaxID=10195 RepID=A0A3M7SSD4_BRAPC|nr:hypothetical protein BpHYR1_012063 [Brachionus plicatilis]